MNHVITKDARRACRIVCGGRSYLTAAKRAANRAERRRWRQRRDDSPAAVRVTGWEVA